MKISLFLLISVLNIINFIHSKEDYSINSFLDQILEDGIYNLLQKIMEFFDNKVAIETCLLVFIQLMIAKK